jgi:bacteriochlorophyllide a dehydrogenase
LDARAVLLEQPERLVLATLALNDPAPSDLIVDIAWSGVSAGTEKLLWQGRMPSFPGMGYPLVPGYESVGRVVDAGSEAKARIGEWVFVPGANCYRDAKGLFGGQASRVVIPSARAVPVPESLGVAGILCALAATAHHAIAGHDAPELIIGHGVVGRLLARLTVAAGAKPPVVWETNAARRDGAEGYAVVDPEADERRDYRTIYDASGDAGLIDTLVSRLGRGGEIVLAGFYAAPISFAFPPAFMREARLRIAAEWTPQDMDATRALIDCGALSLDGLVTDVAPAADALSAYPRAFADPAVLKMVLDWRQAA